ncbi:hypothetical protein H744_2c2576 [Photobacterium gaetbulicola Gung47]|uniref:Uncharacterized protein n=1 Tax=Photobacterium gaetbulicola Gung47 TaxID=658445 RepID=A0A0C5WSA8_9GAMM|nr:hypothetical protein H744_2c2576 [Photobacterium gaetbulicola Gung47]
MPAGITVPQLSAKAKPALTVAVCRRYFDTCSLAAILLQLAVLKHNHPLGPRDHPRVVGGKDKGGPFLFIELLHDIEQLGGTLGIEVGGRLIGHHKTGTRRQRPRDGDPLLLPTRELGRSLVLLACQPHLRQQCTGPLAAGGIIVPLQLHHELDIFQRGKNRQQAVVLENKADMVAAKSNQCLFVELADIAAIDMHTPRAWTIDPPDHIEQRCLARARWPHDRNKLTLFDRKIEIFYRMYGKITVRVIGFA